MECKIFQTGSREKLEQEVNEWLKTHPVSPESMHFQFSSLFREDDVKFVLVHTLVVFYVPMVHI